MKIHGAHYYWQLQLPPSLPEISTNWIQNSEHFQIGSFFTTLGEDGLDLGQSMNN